MSRPRFFSQPLSDEPTIGEDVDFELEPSDFHHLARVMRIDVGEQIEIVTRDSWACYVVEVHALSDDIVTGRVIDEIKAPEGAYHVGLFFGLSKGDKNDIIVRQAVEIGADSVYPVIFERSIIKLDEKKRATRHERLQKIAHSAAMQSHRASVPVVYPIADLDSSDTLAALSSFDALFVLWEEEDGATLKSAVESYMSENTRATRFACIVGPEGGISHREIELLKHAGCVSASLGPTILRVDTANAVTLGVLRALLLERASDVD